MGATNLIFKDCTDFRSVTKGEALVYGLKPEVWGRYRVGPDPRAELQVDPAQWPSALA